MKLFKSVVTSIITALSLSQPMLAISAPNEVYFVPDVESQFNALSRRPDALGFSKGGSPDPSRCRHYQGIVRYQGPGDTPYLFVTRSGNIPDLLVDYVNDLLCLDIGDQPGNLLVVKMDSRDKNGERMRSNRLQHNEETADSPPPANDNTVAYFTFDGNGWPNYGHPGGMDTVGDVLAIAVEHPYNNGDPDVQIMFLDISSPEQPQQLSTFIPAAGDGVLAGLVSITPQANGTYLMLVTGGENKKVWFYESLPTQADGSTNLKSQQLDWNLTYTWTLDVDGPAVGASWPTGIGPAHQTLHFIREGDIDGDLYVAGARNTGSGVFFGDDMLDLYRVQRTGNEFKLIHISTKHKVAYANSDGTLFTADPLGEPIQSHFAAASGYYVSPTGELLFYATEHANNGPIPLDLLGLPLEWFIGGTVKAGEWRHEEMVRPNSPTLNPTVKASDNYVVNEGDVVNIGAVAKPPITKAWAEFYSNDNFSDQYLVIDYDDWNKDDFDNFKNLDGGINDLAFGFSDLTSSWRYFAPMGCTMRANDNNFGDDGLFGTDPFPGSSTKTLTGTGSLTAQGNLNNVLSDDGNNEMNDAVTSFEYFEDCAVYYNSQMLVDWDLNNDGYFDHSGNSVNFSAHGLDGPATINVAVAAVHPVDGRQGNGTVPVTVLNVAPVIDSLSVFDAAGLQLGADVGFALIGLPIKLTASFSDAGIPDHQTATIDWDDNTLDSNTVFTTFSDAHGGNVGQIAQNHTYTEAGQFEINLDITDDDGDSSMSSVIVEVLTAGAAIGSVASEIENLIAVTTDADQLAALNNALDNLISNINAQNGALNEIDNGDLTAALVKIEAAIEYLITAEQAGSPALNILNAQLAMAAQSLAVQAYQQVLTALPSPSNGQQRQLERIEQELNEGATLVLNSDYLLALDAFQEALRRSLNLIS